MRAYFEGVLAQLESWVPTVQRLRPSVPWGDVVQVLNRNNTANWTVKHLRRTAWRLVSEGTADPELLERAPQQKSDERLIRLAAGLKAAGPDSTPPPLGTCSCAHNGLILWNQEDKIQAKFLSRFAVRNYVAICGTRYI